MLIFLSLQWSFQQSLLNNTFTGTICNHQGNLLLPWSHYRKFWEDKVGKHPYFQTSTSLLRSWLLMGVSRSVPSWRRKRRWQDGSTPESAGAGSNCLGGGMSHQWLAQDRNLDLACSVLISRPSHCSCFLSCSAHVERGKELTRWQ